MRDEVKVCVARQRARELDRTLDRAFAHRPMLERVDVALENVAQVAPDRSGLVGHERAEAARSIRRGAVDEDKDWLIGIDTVESRAGRLLQIKRPIGAVIAPAIQTRTRL